MALAACNIVALPIRNPLILQADGVFADHRLCLAAAVWMGATVQPDVTVYRRRDVFVEVMKPVRIVGFEPVRTRSKLTKEGLETCPQIK